MLMLTGNPPPQLALLIGAPHGDQVSMHHDVTAIYAALRRRGFTAEEILCRYDAPWRPRPWFLAIANSTKKRVRYCQRCNHRILSAYPTNYGQRSFAFTWRS